MLTKHKPKAKICYWMYSKSHLRSARSYQQRDIFCPTNKNAALERGVSELVLRLFRSATATKAALEAIDTTTAINDFLFAGVKRVTLRTHIDVKVFTDG